MSPQHRELLAILEDGQPHCAFEFREKLFIVDYRKRLSELKQKGFSLDNSIFCRGQCGRRHNSSPKLWRWERETLF